MPATPLSDHHQTSADWFARAILVIWLITFLAGAWIFALRLAFVLQDGNLFSTSGEEGPAAYALWKFLHGYQVYEWPDRGNYALSLYNYLFYYLYGGALALFRKTDAQILTYGRILTVCFVLAGAAFHWRIVRRILPPSAGRLVRMMAVLAVAVMWTGRSTTGWWSFTLRPDLPALCISTAALLLVLRGLERRSAAVLIAASITFYLAWAFKQSMVLTLGGCLTYLLFTRRWKEIALLAVPFALACASTLALGTREYRRNVVFMPSIAPLVPAAAVRNVLQVTLQTAVFWGLAAMMPLARKAVDGASAQWERDSSAFPLPRRLALIGTVLVVTFVGNAVAVGKVGAGPNYLLEPMTHATTLGCFVLAWCLQPGQDRPRSIARVVALLLVGASAVLPVLTLLYPQGVSSALRWNLVFNKAKVIERKAFVERLAAAPRPVLIVDEILSQPWHATDNKHPALVIDTMSFELAQGRGVIPTSLLQDLLISGKYRSGVFPKDSDVTRAALDNGFRVQPIPSTGEYGRTDLVLLLPPPVAAAPTPEVGVDVPVTPPK